MAAEIFPFRFFDPIRKRWIQARYKAKREDIEARGGVITGPGWTPSDVGGGSASQLAPPKQTAD